ncbi:site-specific DNA-methyltransferase [Ursidibacter sp. B-7004-1]
MTKLKEIFQINQADLDFGIYRILNSRSAEIQQFLEIQLPRKIQTAIQDFNQETAVYNHLYTFFSRYYDNGDFISQRRYKNDTYAIPYSGEEVMLHWANKDQYYTKSGENFSNYAFHLPNGKKVQFRLIEADTAKDNRKDNDQTRLFALAEPQIKIELDENGDEIQTDILPIEELGDELIIRFEYKAVQKKEKQADYIDQAVISLQKFAFQHQDFQQLFELMPTEKDPQRTLVKKHLQDYTTKNTADYFIHKNLGKFLNQELDFYIKNEVMNLDDIQQETTFSIIEQNLNLIKVLKTIGQEIIAFLAQLEDFQKKLWLKKKFVAACHYLITLDHLSENLIEQALQNPKQLEQWKALFNVDASGAIASEFCKNQPHLVVDTSLFDAEFQAKVLREIDNLDEQTDGLLIHSDNFQALNLLQERYKEQVKCIYIDPPYNTNASEIIYKNGYKHSSWNSLIENRVSISKKLLCDNGFFAGTIDYAELFGFGKILDYNFGEDSRIGIVSILINPKGRQHERFFSASSEYMLVYTPNPKESRFNQTTIDEEKCKSFDLIDENNGKRYRLDDFARIRSSTLRKEKPKFFYPIFVNSNLDIISLKHFDNSIAVYPIDNNGVEYSWKVIPETFEENNKNGIYVAKYTNNGIRIFNKFYEQQVFQNIWSDKKYYPEFNGTNLLKNILGENKFSYPKSVYAIMDYVKITAQKSDIILDYFAGSGTTAHAVINLNREDNGKRKYILVEQGEYFDTVLKPRVQKVIYSEKWKDGKPEQGDKGYNGVSQIVKVLKLESYEDTLNNLELRKPVQDLADLGLSESVQNDYLLHYMLDVESKGSLLNTQDFQKPFDYQLNIATSSAGAYQPQRIDLVETFNYLIGLRVEQIDDKREKGIVSVIGKLPNGEKAFILWRDMEKIGYDELNRYLDSRSIKAGDSEFDLIYINGDHNIPTVFADNDDVVKTLKVRSIESEFLGMMFG